MYGDIKHCIVVIEDLLSPVSMVEIEIKYGDEPSNVFLVILGCYRGVVEVTIAASSGYSGVMTGRTAKRVGDRLVLSSESTQLRTVETPASEAI